MKEEKGGSYVYMLEYKGMSKSMNEQKSETNVEEKCMCGRDRERGEA